MTHPPTKRLFDLTLALMGMVPGAILCVLAVIAIRLESRGPAVFRQERQGRGSDTFTLYKLRTMQIDTPDQPSHLAPSTSVTRVGSLLRRLKLDEVPQLLNVLRGDMSLVGPRPCLPTQIEVIEQRHSRQVDMIRPGITGPSQLDGIDMSTPQELAISDARYLTPWRIRADVGILIRTVLGGGAGDAIDPANTSPTA